MKVGEEMGSSDNLNQKVIKVESRMLSKVEIPINEKGEYFFSLAVTASFLA